MLPGNILQWTLEKEGMKVGILYEIEAGSEIRQIVHRPPPASVGS